MDICAEGLVWSDVIKNYSSDYAQCGSRWVPETVGKNILVLKRMYQSR